ncbi:SDR family NAD(P)-dependent oxidoreductase [Flavobacterium saccharophilum]|uniref:NAD(P)-dependent dehydrogenase, short-chain alcohol dehydrogenase family n=1 Tax=Flavobacterium saccharophilum TaxID=29534 RepID=A0A1M7K910_9FLAO|nr:SDR family oxidoreductase [Flavobacterium saccharophilum]SHM61760.1 NAD(P)-dependent dehydrogenase, short-chain alcohol dehydrogenase family [Flavobacterium saccharophilum]
MIQNKKILITGATSGIGLALCDFLIGKDCSVIAIGREKSKIANLIAKGGNKLKFVLLDLNEFHNYSKIFDEALAGEKFDGFVHCAGIEETLPLTMYNPDNVKRIFDINVFSGIELLRNFSKKKYSNDGASVVYLSSVMGELGQPGKIGYCATKAAVLGVVKASALELAKRNFRINAISPGVVNTPMTEKLFSQIDAENIQRIKDMHPLGIGNVEDIVPTIAFLLSDFSKWITGQNIKIDGGYSIQ